MTGKPSDAEFDLAVLRPAFAWNHNAVMAAGEAGLRKYLLPARNSASRP